MRKKDIKSHRTNHLIEEKKRDIENTTSSCNSCIYIGNFRIRNYINSFDFRGVCSDHEKILFWITMGMGHVTLQGYDTKGKSCSPDDCWKPNQAVRFIDKAY
jgi:hypothetical protein